MGRSLPTLPLANRLLASLLSVKEVSKKVGKRLFALEVLYLEESCEDVVRESQEIVELTFKGMLRACHMEVPRIHDVSSVLMKHKNAS